jgi:hypothetical protein
LHYIRLTQQDSSDHRHARPIAGAAAERDTIEVLTTFSPEERTMMIEVRDRGHIGRRSTGAWIRFHGLSAVSASLVSISEFVLDVARDTEAVWENDATCALGRQTN